MTGAVDVALHDVPAKAAVDGGGTLEVDVAAHSHTAQARPVQGFAHHVGAERTVWQHLDHGPADTVHRDRVAVSGIGCHDGPADDQAGRVAELFLADDLTQFFDDSGEHDARISRQG